MIRGHDSDFCEFVSQPQGLHHPPSAWPYSYACSDFSKLACRLIHINLDVGVSRKGNCAGKTAYSTSAEINMRAIRLWVWISTYQIATVNLGI